MALMSSCKRSYWLTVPRRDVLSGPLWLRNAGYLRAFSVKIEDQIDYSAGRTAKELLMHKLNRS